MSAVKSRATRQKPRKDAEDAPIACAVCARPLPHTNRLAQRCARRAARRE